MSEKVDLYLFLLSWFIFMEFGDRKIRKKGKWRIKIAVLSILVGACWRFYMGYDPYFLIQVLVLSVIMCICSEAE